MFCIPNVLPLFTIFNFPLHLKVFLAGLASENVSKHVSPKDVPENTSIVNQNVSTDSNGVAGIPCDVCGKVLKTARTLASHLEKVHKIASKSQTLSGQCFPEVPVPINDDELRPSLEELLPSNKCSVCGKVLASKKNLDTHMQKVHPSKVEVNFFGFCFSNQFLLE